MKSIILILFALSFSITVWSQMKISEIDAKKLGYKKVAKYLKNEELKKLRFFFEIQPSINDSCDLSKFYFHSGTYIINSSVQDVWNICITTSPAVLWNGKMLGLACVYDVNTDNMFYVSDEQCNTLDLKQIYFINLRIMRLFNVAAALMVTKIDADQKLIEFTYIRGNKSVGKQILRLFEFGNNGTKIVHDTFYKSNSKMRDRKFYSRFHQIAITDLHKKIEMSSQ